MAQPPPDQNFYHHPLPHAHPTHPHAHSHPHSHQHPQLQLPPQFRNPFDLLFDDRTGAINYNYIRPYLPNQMPKPDELSDSLVMRRPRRTRTTFTSSQIAELEQHFLQGRYLTAPRLADLSAKLALGTAQVKIWFKNRRRRHKIQSDQNKDPSYDTMPLSPSLPATLKPVDADPPSLQALSLNGNAGAGGGATPNALTPSPTPSTPTAHLMEHYSDTFNAYYNYNGHGHHATHPHANGRPVSHMHGPYSPAAGSPAAQYFSNGNMQQAHPQTQHQLHQQPAQQAPPLLQQALQHPHQHVQHQATASQSHMPHVSAHPNTHAAQSHALQGPQQQQQPHQQQQPQQQQQTYHHFEFQGKSSVACRSSLLKEDADGDYNFNSSYYMRMSAAVPTALPSAAASMVIEATSALSPGSEVYEPLTPKNDESPSLCTGVGGGSVGGACASAVGAVDVTDDMDDGSSKKTTALQNLEPLKNNNNIGAGKACENSNSVLATGLRTTVGRMEIGNACNGVFSKFSKLPSAPPPQQPPLALESMHDTNQYQCTMDTLMQAYNPHRNTGNTQFAYCFN